MVSVAFDFDLFSHAQTKSVLGLLLAPPAFFFPLSLLSSPGAFFLFLASCTQHWHGDSMTHTLIILNWAHGLSVLKLSAIQS